MSAYSTLRLTREKAVSLILSEILQGLTDAELKDRVDMILEKRLYTARIVPDDAENDNDEV